MKRTILSLTSLGLGAALMYWLDPQHGRRRRVDLRNRATSVANQGFRALDIATRDLENRARGFAAEAKGMLVQDEPSDDVLVERARSRLGRACSYPSLIETSCHDGRLVLSGPVLAKEKQQVLSAMSRVPGVRVVESQLESFDRMPRELGIVGPSPREVAGTARRGMTPAGRLITAACGVGACVYGLRRGGFFGSAAALGGGVMILRGITDANMRELLGIGARRPIRLAKTIEVHAPAEEVFGWLSAPEHFPEFMSNVEEVRKLSDGQYHWKVAGPAGTTFEWDSHVTRMVPNKMLAWRTEPGSLVGNSGVIQCEPNRDSTRVTIRMAYQPPAGALGHAFARLFGADPKTRMDEDMVRFKSLIEQGKATAHGRTVHREEIARPDSQEELAQPQLEPLQPQLH